MASPRTPDVPVAAPPSRARAIAFFLVGVVLMAAAIRIAVRSSALDTARHALGDSPWWVFAALLALPLLNLLLTSATFQVLTNRHGRVGYGEMTALIAGSWLFSFVGMFGRIVYHREMHGVPIRASVQVLLHALACSFVGVLALLALTLLAGRLGLGNNATAGVLVAPFIVVAALAVCMKRSSPASHRWRWLAALAYRYLDMGVWALRYLLIFNILFAGISLAEAAGFAAAAQAAMLLPIQIGLREWVIGLLGSTLRPEGLAFAEQLSPGLLADLVNRAAELAIAIPLGTLAAIWLGARWKTRKVPRPS